MMKNIWVLVMSLFFCACSTEYILMDEDRNPVEKGYYTENSVDSGDVSDLRADDYYRISDNIQPEEIVKEIQYQDGERPITANDVFVVGEGNDFVTYQYKNVRVDEISPLAVLYCADVAFGASPYLREVSMYHNGFMRATFDCVNLAI